MNSQSVHSRTTDIPFAIPAQAAAAARADNNVRPANEPMRQTDYRGAGVGEFLMGTSIFAWGALLVLALCGML